ncbi:hypothetical protein ELY25_00715 [Vreelandella populi]|uniref:Uncharacterized protein n=1 Tax=Vreelandella populi TaxID=2498858 RepID=A0A433LDU0_9GAMM|nr:hypothetical protein ELY25_00715 [Halomonas populi]RUR46769.1 hypothetical protein ELY37_08045 [Halomonas populi]
MLHLPSGYSLFKC